ncbi:hypothetical protein C7E18_11395, partial [Stenotrophomonas maltophilia]
MTLAPADLPAALQPLVDRALARLAQVLPEPIPTDLLPLLLGPLRLSRVDTIRPMTLAPADLPAALQPLVDR